MNTALAIATIAIGLYLAHLVRRKGVSTALVALQVFLLFVATFALWRTEQRQDDLESTNAAIQRTQDQLAAERSVRSRVQAEINRYVCRSNNRQDDLLADLLTISLPPDIDERELSGRALKAVEVFREKLLELRDRAPCKAIVAAFLEASDTDDLVAIRRVLREQDQTDQSKPRPPDPQR